MLAGMGAAPALALPINLPAVSVAALVMPRKAFPPKTLWVTGGLVALCGANVGARALGEFVGNGRIAGLGAGGRRSPS
ncbi:hypothetical protein AAER86_26110, partial [Klebsiella pneumoniae]